MYYEHFGLNSPPFKITPDTTLFYSGGNRGLVLEALIYAIENGEGIIKVVGEVGSGKTMLCRMLEAKLPKRVEIVYLANPRLSPDMILHAIALEMHLPVTTESNRLQVMHDLHLKLLEKHAHQQQVVIFIEEAQSMPLATLEEIRLLSNLETDHNKLLQMVLFGQPELDSNIGVSHIRQLKERITHSFYLAPLTRKDVENYLNFRMRAVGYRGPSVFSASAFRALTRVSEGLIRRINILADKSLLAAFAQNTHQVRAKHVYLAAQDSNLSAKRLTWPLGIMGGLVILLLGLGMAGYGEWFKNEWMQVSKYWERLSLPSSQIPPGPPTKNALETSAPISPDPLLEQRLQATWDWLNRAEGYSLQVMQTPEENTVALLTFLRKPEIQPLLEDIYIYQEIQRDRKIWSVVYKDFAEAALALAAIKTLPDVLQRNKPYLRRIEKLRERAIFNLDS